MGVALVKAVDVALQIVPGIADLAKDGGWIAAGGGAPAADADAELDEGRDEADFVRKQQMDKAAAPEGVVSDAERAGGIVALADSGGGPMTSENLMNFGKAGRKAFGQAAAGPGEHLRAEDVDAEFIDMASDNRFGGAPGEQGEGVIAVGELVKRFEVSGRHRFSNGGLKGGRDSFVGAVVPRGAFSGRVG